MRDKVKIAETSLVLTTGFLILFLLTENYLLLFVSVFMGITGLFIKPLASFITFLWFKLAEVLNYVVSKVVMSILFFLVLLPVSVLYRLAGNDRLNLKQQNSTWRKREIEFKSSDFINIW